MSKYKKPKKAVKKETGLQQFSVFFMEMMISIYVFILLTLYPLYFHDKYYDMGDAKYTFYKYLSFLFLGALLLGSAIWILAYFKEESIKTILKRFSVTDWFALAFLVISYISFLFSSDKKMAFYGFNGWYMGLMSQLMFVLLYFFVTKFWKWSPATLISAMVAAAIAYFLAVIMRFGFDPLAMYENLSEENIEKFISTLGQTTWYSSYAVLIFPLGLFWYYNDEKKLSRIFAAIFIAFGTMSLCTVNSDSAYIAFAFIMMAFLYFAMDDNNKFLRFLEMAIIMLASCRVIGILQDLFPERMIKLITGDEKITHFVTHSTFMLIATVLVIAIYLGMRYIISSSYDKVRKEYKFQISKYKFIRLLPIILTVVVVAMVVLLIVLTTNKMLPSFLSSLYNVSFFNFDNGWGNHRGFNWRASFCAIKNASLKDLIIGVGPDSFCHAMDMYYAEEVSVYWHGLKLACAHNEFLNMLINEGILGAVAYLGFMISSVVRCGKVAKKEAAAIPIIAIVVAYIGHNFFCYQQCICTPILFLFVGIGEVVIKSVNGEQEK